MKEDKNPVPLCLVDFETLDIYSLQDTLHRYMMIISTEECIKGCMNLANYRILAGGSSGAVFAACNKFANEHELRRKRIVGILPDRGGHYMDSIYNIDWRNNLDY